MIVVPATITIATVIVVVAVSLNGMDPVSNCPRPGHPYPWEGGWTRFSCGTVPDDPDIPSKGQLATVEYATSLVGESPLRG
jgi:hypothetical protein